MKLFPLKLVFSLIMLFSVTFAQAQSEAEDEMPIVSPVNLDGPRVGFTYIAPGETADKLKDNFEVDPFITQFGWQFETRYFTLPNGTAGLVEGVVLVGGLEQGVFRPSASLLVGIRNARGLEFGFGPNLSLSGAAFVFAAGVTFQSHYVNFPVNFAFVPSSDGFLFSLLTGFNARKR